MHLHAVRALDAAPVAKVRLEGLLSFALAPVAAAPYSVAVFVPERKGQAASVKLFQGPDFARLSASKTFYKAEKATFKWNKQGTACLVTAHTDVDQSGQSYYGETSLYFLTTKGMSARVSLEKDGPVYDTDWSPRGNEFCVVYGYMPSQGAPRTSVCDVRVYTRGSQPLSQQPCSTTSAIPSFTSAPGRVALCSGVPPGI